MPQVDPGVVDQHIQPAQVAGGLVDHPPDRPGVGQVGSHHGVARAGQPVRHLGGQRG
jgi:hypothetical protein